ncbi:HAD family hydrolase [Curtobacterium sp. MCLR17_034]|uniref:HAD family hydrolase n=1 Tax=Curtobacterium sp. MCLR17_034 TaxID=2175623 RepID=UPI000DA85977|nr:HAD family hydrolase [Curtobacterium sp. MCLR17_034]PZF11310.1 HAD family hydrolase [Curtobacterium sp. MCLR17_034]
MGVLRAVCFDLDGTLFDHRGSARAGATRFLESLGIAATESALESWFAAEDAQFERWRSGQISFQEQRRERLRTALPSLGCQPPSDEIGLDSLFDGYLASYRASWRVFPGSVSLLRELRGRGYRLGLLTNGTEEQQLDKLTYTGLDGAFDAVCVSERIGLQKPDERAFLTVAHELGVDASDCLFVGDSAAHDIAGARTAGMHGLLVNHSAEEAVGIKTAVLACITAHGDAR